MLSLRVSYLYTMQIYLFSWMKQGDAMCWYAYSFIGKPAVAQKLLGRGHHLSAIAIMSTVGVLDCKIVDCAVDGNTMYEFVQNCLLPHLMPFYGANPHSIVILDNASMLQSIM